MFKKLSTKLIFAYVSLIICLTLIVFLLLGTLLRDTHISMIRETMAKDTSLIELKMKELGIKTPARFKKEIDLLSRIMKLRITIIKNNGLVIADSEVDDASRMDNHLYRKEISSALEDKSGYSIRYSNTLKIDMLYYAHKSSDYVIRLAQPLYEVESSLNSLKSLILNVSLIVIITSILIITLISIKFTRPINETMEFALDFTKGNYNKRILNYSEDEIGILQNSLNKMADTIVATLKEHIFEQEKLKTTIESISDGIALIDGNKSIIISNNSFLEMLSIKTTLENKQYFEVIRNRKLNSMIEQSLKKIEKSSFELQLQNERILEIILSPIQSNKSLQGILIVLHDISERKKIEQIKSDLVSNVSHELKTPIAIVKGYLETIDENLDNREMTREFISRAIDNIDRQNAIIEDIIKLSMIESSTDFQNQIIDIRNIVENCIEILSPKIQQKGITVKAKFKKSDSFSISGNQFLAEEIFFNLIDNALNYNKENGTINISGEVLEDKMVFKVKDSGIGIPEESIDRIFERFYRVNKGRSRTSGGTGLGLSIVKHAVMVQQWNISVKSGCSGTTFTIITGK